jgi:multicomponent Na+:H+ antiporter subunit F
MTSFLVAAAGFVLAMAAIGLFGIFLHSSETDRLMAAQLLGTDSIAILLLLSIATEAPPIVDVALLLALLAAFAAVAFVRSATLRARSNAARETGRR